VRRRRGAQEPVHLQTAERLRGLRVRLTVLLLAFNLVGLCGVGSLTLVVDSQQRGQLVDAELNRTAGTTAALLYYNAGALQVDKLFRDPSAQGVTAVYVYEAGRSDLSLVFAHPAGLRLIPPGNLLGPARQVWWGERAMAGSTRDELGERVQFLAVPFRHQVTGAVAGTVVVVADPRPAQLAHRRLAIALIAGGAAFLVLSGFAGSLLARRGTRAAAQALGQQERFVADAAHELRTPLTTIRAVCEAAVIDAGRARAEPVPEPGEEPQTVALRSVLAAARRLGDSVEALLARARLVAGTRELDRQPFRLDQLAADVVADTVQPPHRLTVSAAATVCQGDPALVAIALRNLAHNAVRHGRGDGEPAEVHLIVATGLVRIEDNGPGPPRHPAGRRFAAGSPGGIGIGLAIVEWIAQLHAGALRLERASGGGTAATLELPDPPAPSARRRLRGRLRTPGGPAPS
jgi:two-component system OmpR family sensor kinase